ncbi:DUF4397 domain-containing protein [Sinomicrobium sp. M5D2P17]
MKKSKILKLCLMLCMGIIFVACDEDDDYIYYYPEDIAYGLLVNASPGSGDLYLYADENQINQDPLNYTDARGYYNFYTGDRLFFLKNQNGETLDSLSVNLSMGEYFSVFAAGTYGDNIELALYPDNVDYPGGGNAMLRFINLSPDAPSVDIWNGDEVLAEDLDFKQASVFIKMDDGTYDFKFTDASTGELLFKSDAMDLYGGRTYTIYAKGYVNPPSGSNDVLSIDRIVNF